MRAEAGQVQSTQRVVRKVQAATSPARCEVVQRRTTTWRALAVSASETRNVRLEASAGFPVRRNVGMK